MYCQKCQAKMQHSYVGHSKNTVELWACSDESCGFTFEMRTDSRGFYFCLPQDNELDCAVSPSPERAKAQCFPNQVFEIGNTKGASSVAGRA